MRLVAGSVLAFALMQPAAAEATEFQVNFRGLVTQVGGQAVGGPFVEGDPVTGVLAYRTTDVVDELPLDPLTGYYIQPSPILSFAVTIGSYTAVGDVGSSESFVLVDDGSTRGVPPTDSVYFRTGAAGAPVNGLDPRVLQFAMWSFDLTRLSGDDVPTGTELLHFTKNDFGIWGVNFLNFEGATADRVDWQLTSVRVIPEPQTATLVLLGIVVLAMGRRRGC